MVKEEADRLKENLYSAQEDLAMLDDAGFRDAKVESSYSGRLATAEHAVVAFVPRK